MASVKRARIVHGIHPDWEQRQAGDKQNDHLQNKAGADARAERVDAHAKRVEDYALRNQLAYYDAAGDFKWCIDCDTRKDSPEDDNSRR